MEKVFDKNDKFGTINSIRQLLIEELKDYEGEPIKLDLNGISGIDGLESLIFKDYVDSNKKNVKIIAFSYDVLGSHYQSLVIPTFNSSAIFTISQPSVQNGHSNL